MNIQKRIVIVTLMLALGAGCAGKGKKSSNHAAKKGGWRSAQQSQPVNGAQTSGYGEAAEFSGEDTFGQSVEEQLAKKTYLFGFDKFDVSGQDEDMLKAHARYLAENPGYKVRVEGHTDERGSREYNIALGERRAKAVNNFLVSHGASPSQIRLVSYGQEKPASFGSDESAYRLNRRAIIVYEE